MSYGFGVGDFVGTAALAWNLYQNCYKIARGAPHDFQTLVKEINTTHSSIKLIEQEAMDPNSVLVLAGPDRVQMVRDVISRVDSVLRTLDVFAKKYAKFGDPNRHKMKKMWDGIKWSADAGELDGLRNSLMFHNGVMSLLLTTCGNSSLQRIEESNTKLERRFSRIQGLIQGLGTKNSSKLPQISALGGGGSKVLLLSATLMKHAEVGQRRWSAVGIEEWIHAGRWWLLRGQFRIGPIIGPSAGHTSAVWRQGYADLVKASWILIDIIARHPQLDLLDSNIRCNVELLAETIANKLGDIDSSRAMKPTIDELLTCDLQIWQSELLGLAAGNILSWVTDDDYLHFERFGQYHRNGTAIHCMILLLVDKRTKDARMVLKDQTSRTLAEFHVGKIKPSCTENCFELGDQKIELSTRRDVSDLYSLWQASEEYSTFSNCNDPVYEILPTVALLCAVKNNQIEFIKRTVDEKRLDPAAGPSGACFSERLSFAVLGVASQSLELVARQYQVTTDAVWLWALDSGHRNVAMLFLEAKGIYISEKEIDKCSSLYDSAAVGLLGVVRLHLLYGANFNGERAPLQAAAAGGHEDVVQVLLQAGADVDSVLGRQTRFTALQAAARGGHLAVVDRLLKHGAEVNAGPVKSNGRTALQAAAGGGHLDVVHRLLEKGAHVNAKPGMDDGRTALQAAAEGGHLAVVDRLLEKGAQVNAEPTKVNGRTALQAAAEGGFLDVVDRLLKEGAQVNAEQAIFNGRTALQAAAEGGFLVVVDRLLEKGANIHSKSTEWH